jgi:hypothetical protein
MENDATLDSRGLVVFIHVEHSCILACMYVFVAAQAPGR